MTYQKTSCLSGESTFYEMAGFGDYTGYNRPYGLDPNRETNDLYDTRFQQIYGYHTPITEEFQGPPLVMDDSTAEGNNFLSFYML